MKILIAGDSWAMGEWNPEWQGPENQILHKGLEQYLLDDNYDVTNISGVTVLTGAGNRFSKQRLLTDLSSGVSNLTDFRTIRLRLFTSPRGSKSVP